MLHTTMANIVDKYLPYTPPPTPKCEPPTFGMVSLPLKHFGLTTPQRLYTGQGCAMPGPLDWWLITTLHIYSYGG